MNSDKLWDLFCEELTQEPTQDMKEALATFTRGIAEHLYGEGTYVGKAEQERFNIADELMELAEEFENLK